MRVQLIKYGGGAKDEKNNIFVSPLHEPRALDDFDINIIDLSVPAMWTTKGNCTGDIDSLKDLDTICQMVSNKKHSAVVYVFPQNISYRYNTGYVGGAHTTRIKDILAGILQNSITRAIPSYASNVRVAYEKTVTVVGELDYNADLYFLSLHNIITQSVKSEKPTTVQIATGIYATTLDITKTTIELKYFISSLFEKHERSKAPDWMENIIFGDDALQKELIKECEAEITRANEKASAAKRKLEENAQTKSILYTNGDELVTEVIKILEKVFGYDLSGFKDEKREDFLIKLSEHTFIGEIKGVSSNVRYEHISQVELHYRGYLDDLAEMNVSENVKQLLIINPFRKKPLEQREPIHIDQIELAERNECLIIETQTLLRLYEKFCAGEISVSKCIEIFCTKSGLLGPSDF